MAGRSATASATDRIRDGLLVALVLLVGGAVWATPGGTVTGRVATADGKGVSDAVVFLQDLPDAAIPPPPAEPLVMDQRDKQFVPNVLPLQVGSKVVFPNHDQIHHHVYSFSRTKNFELPLYKGEAVEEVVFDKVGYVKVGCNIHDWMNGHILVVPSPFFTRTDANGDFELPDVPAGKVSVAVWHQHSGEKVPETAREVDVDANGAEVSFTLSIKEGRSRPAVHGVRSYE